MSEKKILVTGAGGYIGRHVVKALLDKGAKVTACDLSLKECDPRAQALECSIFDLGDHVYEALGRPDVCVHMAWKDGFVHGSQAHMEMLSEHYRFLCKLIESGLSQLAVMGTMHEIGYHEGAIREDTPSNPISMYGIAKDALRRSLTLFCQGKNTVLQWLRAYYIYGDDKKNHSIFAKLLQAAEEGKQTFPFTSGKNLYDFISMDELAEQIAASAMQTKVTGIINCCSGKPVSLAEQVESFIKEHHLNITLDYGAFPDRPYDSPGVWGDAEKIRQIMNHQ